MAISGWEISGDYRNGLVTARVISPEAFKHPLYFGSDKHLNTEQLTYGVPVSIAIGAESQAPRIVGSIAATPIAIRVSRWPKRRHDTAMSVFVRNELTAAFPITDVNIVAPEFEAAEPSVDIRVITPGKPGGPAASLIVRNELADIPNDPAIPAFRIYGLAQFITEDQHRRLLAGINECVINLGRVPTQTELAAFLDQADETTRRQLVHVITTLAILDEPGRRPEVLYDTLGNLQDVGVWQRQYFAAQ